MTTITGRLCLATLVPGLDPGMSHRDAGLGLIAVMGLAALCLLLT